MADTVVVHRVVTKSNPSHPICAISHRVLTSLKDDEIHKHLCAPPYFILTHLKDVIS